jgi:hypothetical protein
VPLLTLVHCYLDDVMIIRSGLRCQRMEKRRSAFDSDDGAAFTAIAADSVETLSVLALARRMTGMAHPEFGHSGAFAHPASFAQCLQLWGRGRCMPQSCSVAASVLQASLVDEPYAYTELPAGPDRVKPALVTLAHCF